MSYYAEPYSSRKRRSKKTLFMILTALLIGLGIPGIFYGPRLYYLYSGDPILRLEKRARQFEVDLREGKRSPVELYEFIADSRSVLAYLEKDHPVRAEIQYYRGLFEFYEILIRVPITGESAVRLVGRYYLPEEPAENPLREDARLIPLADLGKNTAMSMRRALALDPDLPQKRAARLAIALGDLLFTARTDPILLEYIKESDEELPEFFKPYHAWLSLVLLGMRGRIDDLEIYLGKRKTDGTDSALLQLKGAHIDLILAFGNFQAKKYNEALQHARSVKGQPELTPFLRSEAARIEGEIFLVQRGSQAARPYFQEAVEIGGKEDEFLKARLAELKE